MIVLFNPLSTTPGKQPLPLSVMSLAAVLEGRHEWTLVDGNVCPTPASEIIGRLGKGSGGPSLVAVSVMPGPQLTQAVDVCRKIRESRPATPIVWGGYFPTQHADTVLKSSLVDFVVRSQGETPLLELIRTLAEGDDPSKVPGLSWKLPNGEIIHNSIGTMTPLDELPELPYHRVEMEDYIHPTYLGSRTVAHNSSFGCPFSCSFCAVVAMTNRRWLAESPERMERVLSRLARVYRVNAVQMHDMDFFINERRVEEFARRITPLNLHWWALGRIDTLMSYSDATWAAMKRSGLTMVFSGAESSSDAVLEAMNKGGKASAHLAIDLAKRMRSYGIVPEYSFVLGSPPDPERDMAQTFEFIRDIKKVNPATEIVLYTYTPVPMEGELFDGAMRLGFAFPKTIDQWATPVWEQFSMRRGDGIPWVDGAVRRRVRNFERVINAFYPTATDPRLTTVHKAALKAASAWRYALRWYDAPYELRALHRLFRYQRPETTGF